METPLAIPVEVRRGDKHCYRAVGRQPAPALTQANERNG